MDKLTRKDIEMILGDINVKAGRGKIYRKMTGGERKQQKSTNEGIKLITLGTQ